MFGANGDSLDQRERGNFPRRQTERHEAMHAGPFSLHLAHHDVRHMNMWKDKSQEESGKTTNTHFKYILRTTLYSLKTPTYR